MNYEILNDAGEVINTIVATPEFVEENYPGHYRLIPDSSPLPLPRIITVPAWFDRFDWCCDTPKQIALLADPDPVCQALVKMSDVRINQGINLDSPNLPLLLGRLVTAGKINQNEANRIVQNAVRPDEVFRG